MFWHLFFPGQNVKVTHEVVAKGICWPAARNRLETDLKQGNVQAKSVKCRRIYRDQSGKMIEDEDLFAEAVPEDKYRIVNTLQMGIPWPGCELYARGWFVFNYMLKIWTYRI